MSTQLRFEADVGGPPGLVDGFEDEPGLFVFFFQPVIDPLKVAHSVQACQIFIDLNGSRRSPASCRSRGQHLLREFRLVLLDDDIIDDGQLLWRLPLQGEVGLVLTGWYGQARKLILETVRRIVANVHGHLRVGKSVVPTLPRSGWIRMSSGRSVFNCSATLC